MIIKTSLDKSDVINRIRERVYTTEDYSHMKWQEKYCCEKDYYGDVIDNGFIISKTSRGVHRNGVQHLTVKGCLLDENDKVWVSVRPTFNGTQLLIMFILIGSVIYSILTNNLFVVIVPSFFAVIYFLASVFEYKEACLFLVQVLCDDGRYYE